MASIRAQRDAAVAERVDHRRSDLEQQHVELSKKLEEV